jgi:hypothetical protein
MATLYIHNPTGQHFVFSVSRNKGLVANPVSSGPITFDTVKPISSKGAYSQANFKAIGQVSYKPSSVFPLFGFVRVL